MLLKDRAVEIISSSLNFEVLHNGKPVWIQSVTKETDLAQVVMCGSDEKIEVPISELEETGVVSSL